MKMVKHDHVVQLYEVLASRTKIFIVLQLVTGGELFDKIVAESRLKEDDARFYFRQLVNGVKYCHQQGVCHRDLKPENLLLDEHDNLKISDFGLSTLYTGGGEDESRAKLLHTTCGTPNYVAPEVLNDKGYDGRAADVWSMGVILYVLLAGFLPFDEPSMPALFRKIQKAEFSYPSWFSKPICSLLDQILIADPAKRISLVDVEKDPWYSAGGPAPAPAAAPAKAAAVAHVPSAKDMSEAISEGAAEEESKADAGPSELNAFEVVNMFGGMSLNRLLLTSGAKAVRKFPQIISGLEASDIATKLKTAAAAVGLKIDAADSTASSIKGTILTAKGEVSVNMIVYSMSPSLRLVSVVRGKGDLLEYNKMYATLAPHLAELAIKKA